jgi:hypothetical protein
MADKAAAAGGLRALAAGTEGRSGSALVYELLADIEAALTTGVARKTVLAALNRDYGFTLTMSGFEKALKKARRRRPPAPAPPPLQTPDNSASDADATPTQHRPQTQGRPVTTNQTAASPTPIALPTADGTAPPPPFENPAALKQWLAAEKTRIGQATAPDEFIDNWPYEETHETSRD